MFIRRSSGVLLLMLASTSWVASPKRPVAPHETAPSPQASSLRSILADNGVAAWTEGPDLDTIAFGHEIEDGGDLFIIAYYPSRGAMPAAPDELGISVLDRPSNSWRHGTFSRDVQVSLDDIGRTDFMLGEVVRIRHSATHIYLDTHINPSAGVLLVINAELEPVVALYGWLLLPLADGSALYHRSAVHFAPTHTAEAWLYSADRDEDARLYPQRPYGPVRREYIETVRGVYEDLGVDWFRENNHHMDPERFNSAIGRGTLLGRDGTAVAFVAVFGAEDVPAATPALDVMVVCTDIRSAAPRCAEEKIDALRQLHPGWSDTRILEEALRR